MTLETLPIAHGKTVADGGESRSDGRLAVLLRKAEASVKGALRVPINLSDMAAVASFLDACTWNGLPSGLSAIMAEKLYHDRYIANSLTRSDGLGRLGGFFSSGRMAELRARYSAGTSDELMRIMCPGLSGLHPAMWGHTKKDLESQCRNLSSDEVAGQIEELFVRFDGQMALDILRHIAEQARFSSKPGEIADLARFMNTAGVDLYDTFRHDFNKVNFIFIKGFHNCVTDRDSAMAVMAYVLSVEDSSFTAENWLVNTRSPLPEPTAQNIGEYRRIVLGYLSDTYGIKEELDWNSILRLIPMERERRERLMPMISAFGFQKSLEWDETFEFSKMEKEEVADFAGIIAAARERNVREYAIKYEGDSARVEELRYSHRELLEHSVIAVIGSRSEEREGQARGSISSIVGERTVSKAREEFNRGHRRLLGEIVGAMKRSDFEAARATLQETGEHAIMDVLNAANYREVLIPDASFIRAAESKNPLDYDSRVQIACVFLPNMVRGGIRDYCKNEDVVLVRYDIGNKTLGSAICYKEGDKFLVDSVEGHRTFRKEGVFEVVYEDLLKRAKDHDAKTLLFYADASNETARRFNEHLGKRGLRSGKIDMDLKVNGAYIEATHGAECYVVGLYPV